MPKYILHCSSSKFGYTLDQNISPFRLLCLHGALSLYPYIAAGSWTAAVCLCRAQRAQQNRQWVLCMLSCMTQNPPRGAVKKYGHVYLWGSMGKRLGTTAIADGVGVVDEVEPHWAISTILRRSDDRPPNGMATSESCSFGLLLVGAQCCCPGAPHKLCGFSGALTQSFRHNDSSLYICLFQPLTVRWLWEPTQAVHSPFHTGYSSYLPNLWVVIMFCLICVSCKWGYNRIILINKISCSLFSYYYICTEKKKPWTLPWCKWPLQVALPRPGAPCWSHTWEGNLPTSIWWSGLGSWGSAGHMLAMFTVHSEFLRKDIFGILKA